MTRTDIHSPSRIVPADYTFLFAYARPSSVDGWPVPGYNLELLQATRTGLPVQGYRDPSITIKPLTHKFASYLTGGPIRFSDIHKNGACDVCGAYHIEGSVFFHVPSAEAIALGWQCAENLELDFDESERALIAGNRKAARKVAVARARRFAFLRNFVENEDAEILSALKLDHHITRSIRQHVIRTGNVSDLQRPLLLKLAREASKPAEAEEKHVRAPVEDGRQRVEGLIVGVKSHESDFGSTLKITVKVETPDGSWLTWGTAPSALLSLVQHVGGLRGATVAFDAKLKRADSEHFTFFGRPTKPALLAVSSDEARAELTRIQDGLDFDAAEPEDEFTGTPAHREWKAGEEAKRDNLARLLGGWVR